VTELHVFCNGVSFSASSGLKVQLGTSIGFVETGYSCLISTQDGPSVGFSVTSEDTGFATNLVTSGGSTSFVMHKPFGDNIWECRMSGILDFPSVDFNDGKGFVDLSGVLTQVKILPRTGSPTFSTGKITIGYR